MSTKEKVIILLGVIFLLLFVFTGNRNFKLENELNKKDAELNSFIETVTIERTKTINIINKSERIIENLLEQRDSLRQNQNKIKTNVKNNQEESLQYINIATSSIEQRDGFWAIESTIQDTIIPFPR